MELHIAVTCGEGLLGRLGRWYGLMWSHAALGYVRDRSTEPCIIEASACGIRERFWAVLAYLAHVCSGLVYDCFLCAGVDLLPGHVDVLVTPDDLANSPLLQEVESS